MDVMSQVLRIINGQHLYFDANGRQVKGGFVTNTDGSRSFYHWNTGDKLVSTFFTTGHDRWYYADDKGNVVTGAQVINGQKLFFATDGKQVKGDFATNANGSRSYYHGATGNKLVSTFFTTGDNNWYYADAKGELVVGEQTINGQNLYFDQTGKQVKGQQLRILMAQSLTMMFIQGKRLLIVGLKFLQGNGYTSTLKEKGYVKLRLMNERSQSLLWLLFQKIVSLFIHSGHLSGQKVV